MTANAIVVKGLYYLVDAFSSSEQSMAFVNRSSSNKNVREHVMGWGGWCRTACHVFNIYYRSAHIESNQILRVRYHSNAALERYVAAVEYSC